MQASDYRFVNIWGWKEEYDLSWAFEQDLVWLRQKRPALRYWAPVGRPDDGDWRKRLECNFPEPAVFTRVPENIMMEWKKQAARRIQITEARHHWDYRYSAMALEELKGNKYHKKKNLLRQFTRKYHYEFIPLAKNVLQYAMDTQEEWCQWRNCESDEVLQAENRAISRILSDWERLRHLCGALLWADDELAAFTIGEHVDDTLIVHFEKGLPRFRGGYQAINQLFVQYCRKLYGVNWINREQDLGDAGLRKAKLSYHPDHYIPKFDILWRP